MTKENVKKKMLVMPAITGAIAGLTSVAVFYLVTYLQLDPPFSYFSLVLFLGLSGMLISLILMKRSIPVQFRSAFITAFISVLTCSLIVLTEIAIRMEYEASDFLSVFIMVVLFSVGTSGLAGLLFFAAFRRDR